MDTVDIRGIHLCYKAIYINKKTQTYRSVVNICKLTDSGYDDIVTVTENYRVTMVSFYPHASNVLLVKESRKIKHFNLENRVFCDEFLNIPDYFEIVDIKINQ